MPPRARPRLESFFLRLDRCNSVWTVGIDARREWIYSAVVLIKKGGPVKRLLIVCLLMLLSLILATSATASPRAISEHARGQVAITPDPVIYDPDVRSDSLAADSSRAAESARKASPSKRGVVTDQEIGDGQCFEYVLFGFWHVWAGCKTSSGGGGGGGW